MQSKLSYQRDLLKLSKRFCVAVSEFPELLSLPVHVVESGLKALKMNSEEARLKFPRLLQIIELYPTETLDLMAKEVCETETRDS